MAHTLINPELNCSAAGIRIGTKGMGILMLAASWSNQYKTKGIIPKVIVEKLLQAPPEIIDLIIVSGLWEQDENNYFFANDRYFVFKGHEHRLKIPISIREQVLARDGNKCKYCESDSDLQIDHVIPWSKGGAHGINNFQTLCGTCNRKKGAKLNG